MNSHLRTRNGTSPGHARSSRLSWTPARAARKKRQKRLADSVDGRSLRATGRTEHLNFKAKPEIKALLAKHVPKGTVSLWLEEAIIAKLKAEGVEVDA